MGGCCGKKKEEEDGALVESNPEQVGANYIKAQQNLPDVVVGWMQNDYGQLARHAEGLAHALVEGGLARRVAYVEPNANPQGGVARVVEQASIIASCCGVRLSACALAFMGS